MSLSLISWIGVAAGVLIATGAAGVGHLLLISPQSPIPIGIHNYQERLRGDLQFLHFHIDAQKILLGQLGAICAFVLVIAFSKQWLFTPLILFFAMGPKLWLQNQRLKRITRIEEQLDGWMLTLANALKASASLGEAIASSAGIMHAPIGQEIDLLIKEYKLGTALDQGMQNMSERVCSRSVSSALLTLRIARNTGGDLPKTLETAAAGLREMARLEGVVRTKTAEGKAQALVIAAIPFPLFAGLHWIEPNFLRPLAVTFTGHLVVAAASALWLAAIAIARKVLAVDI